MVVLVALDLNNGKQVITRLVLKKLFGFLNGRSAPMIPIY